MLICFTVIVDAVLIIALLYKDVMFSALFFPTVFFINVRKICCGIVTYIDVCIHALQIRRWFLMLEKAILLPIIKLENMLVQI